MKQLSSDSNGFKRRVQILGCGSSGGIPLIGGYWGECDPEDPRNSRLRCSILIEQEGPKGITRLLIDTGPDLRQQLLRANIGHIDAVAYTHTHADHVNGIDDLRIVSLRQKKLVPVWADAETGDFLKRTFGYVFQTPEGSDYPPILSLHQIKGRIQISGEGGEIDLTPICVNHGRIDALGFRFGDVAYIPDVLEIYEESWPLLAGLDLWIVDCLRRAPHPSHTHLAKTLSWIERIKPQRAVLTNLNDLDYSKLDAETPAHIRPAYDGLVLEI